METLKRETVLNGEKFFIKVFFFHTTVTENFKTRKSEYNYKYK